MWSKGKVIQLAQNHINSLPFHFKSIRPTIPEIQLFRINLEKTHLKFLKKICQNNRFQQNFQEIWSGKNRDQGIKAVTFCSDPMNGSHFITQTSKFLLIDATAVTLGQGHGKVIQYISPDPYIICAK